MNKAEREASSSFPLNEMGDKGVVANYCTIVRLNRQPDLANDISFFNAVIMNLDRYPGILGPKAQQEGTGNPAQNDPATGQLFGYVAGMLSSTVGFRGTISIEG